MDDSTEGLGIGMAIRSTWKRWQYHRLLELILTSIRGASAASKRFDWRRDVWTSFL